MGRREKEERGVNPVLPSPSRAHTSQRNLMGIRKQDNCRPTLCKHRGSRPKGAISTRVKVPFEWEVYGDQDQRGHSGISWERDVRRPGGNQLWKRVEAASPVGPALRGKVSKGRSAWGAEGCSQQWRSGVGRTELVRRVTSGNCVLLGGAAWSWRRGDGCGTSFIQKLPGILLPPLQDSLPWGSSSARARGGILA